ncbi:MAG: hypothetical protein HeimC3_53230 [Candidatus Heimdallarchaeota archaeon LC_3]|nr:MAG: hypothetical protein HeimC3_53230 [Candidatus Heimdallarchaeota archaeon LC_3]
MILFIEKVKISIKTKQKLFICFLEFNQGLNIIQGNNSKGKSSVLNSIIYALGLEIIIGKKGPDALKVVLTDEITEDLKSYKVLESKVELKIKNAKNESKLIIRYIKSRDFQSRLVKFGDGELYLDKESENSRLTDYFLHDSGSVSRKAGFHNKLLNFLNIELPKVQLYNLKESILYLECIFPLFFIEQRVGWSGIQSTIPSVYRIKQPALKAFEFILKFRSNMIQEQKEIIKRQISDLKIEIRNFMDKIKNEINLENGIIENYQDNIDKLIEMEWIPSISFRFEQKVYNIDEFISELESRLIIIDDQIEVDVKNNNEKEKMIEDITNFEDERVSLETLFNTHSHEKFREESNLTKLQNSLNNIASEERRYKDLKKLQTYGSKLESLIINNQCPTCDQLINDVVFEEIDYHPLSIDETLNYLNQQKSALNPLINLSKKTINIKDQIITEIKSKINIIRKNIDEIRSYLEKPIIFQNLSEIRHNLNLEDKIESIKSLNSDIPVYLDRLNDILNIYKELKEELHKLTDEDINKEDLHKIAKFEEIFKIYLKMLRFNSISVNDIEISKDNYLPIWNKDGIKLVIQKISESDNIRLILSYYLALLKLSFTHETNHFGILILDEPRQQNMNESDYIELYSVINEFKGDYQIIVASSSKNTFFKELSNKFRFKWFQYNEKSLFQADNIKKRI